MVVDTAFEFPADLQKAWKHRLANRIFKGISQESTSNERCECCDRRVGEEEVQTSCCYSPINELVFLGPGVPLLFVFIQNGIMILFTFTLVFTVYALVSNILGTSCSSHPDCTFDLFNQLSLSNKIDENQSVLVQTYLIAGFLFMYLFLAQLMMFRIRKNNEVCDEIINSPSDYSIIIKNLPPDVENKDIEKMLDDFRKLLNQHQRQITKDLALKKIIISYAMGQYLKERERQQKQFLKIKKQNKDAWYHQQEIKMPTKTSSIAIVIFDKQVSKQMFFEQYTLEMECKYLFVDCCEASGRFLVKEHPVIIKRAPEPDDIIWENTAIPKIKLYRNVFISYFFGILILGSGGVIQYFLEYEQQKLKDSYFSSYFSYAASIIVTIYNAIIVQFLILVTKLQGHRTKTELDQSLLIKICLYSFFNSGIFYSLANILATSVHNFDIQGDFSFQITLFMGLNAVQGPLTNLVLNKIQFPGFIFRYLLKNGYMDYSQKDANKLYELTSVDFPVEYAYVIKTIWLTCFYAPFAPIVVPISIFGLFLFYLTEAELFRTKYKAPDMISINITRAAMRLLDFTGIILSSGQILIMLYIQFRFKSEINVIEQAGIGLCLGLSAILIFVPANKINKRIFKFDNKYENDTDYDVALNEFQTTYQATYPLSEPTERRKKSDINLLKQLRIFEQFELAEIIDPPRSSRPLFDKLIQQREPSIKQAAKTGL